MENKKAWYGANMLFSISLILVGIYVIAESFRTSLPLIESEEASLYDMPGLAPIVCAFLLMILAGHILLRSVREGGSLKYFTSPEFKAVLLSHEAKTLAKVFFLLFVYVFALFPLLPYWLSTLIFLTGFMAVFGALSWKTLILSCAVSFTILYVFGTVFTINLP